MVTLAKFLSYEFRSVKQIYVVGFLSCLGFGLSIGLLVVSSYYQIVVQSAKVIVEHYLKFQYFVIIVIYHNYLVRVSTELVVIIKLQNSRTQLYH